MCQTAEGMRVTGRLTGWWSSWLSHASATASMPARLRRARDGVEGCRAVSYQRSCAHQIEQRAVAWSGVLAGRTKPCTSRSAMAAARGGRVLVLELDMQPQVIALQTGVVSTCSQSQACSAVAALRVQCAFGRSSWCLATGGKGSRSTATHRCISHSCWSLNVFSCWLAKMRRTTRDQQPSLA